MKYQITIEGQMFTVEIEDLSARPVIAVVDGERFEVWPEAAAELPPAAPYPDAAPSQNRRRPAAAPAASSRPPAAAGPLVRAPIPGVIASVEVKVGDTVAVGDPLCVLEAMKMKNTIRATRAGRIAEIAVSVGQQVNHGDPLLSFAE